MTKPYELPNKKMIMADVDEVHHTATVSVYALDDLVEAVNKTGYWIMHENLRECSWCGVFLIKDMPRNSYCPNCGCRMFTQQESEDLGDYPDTIHNQFDNMTGSMNL